jgi:hypothetical protein
MTAYKAVMRFFLIFFFLLLCAFLGIYGAGSALPAKQILIRGVMIPDSADSVWKRISNLEETALWHPGIHAISKVNDSESEQELWEVELIDERHILLGVNYRLPPDILRWRSVESRYPLEMEWEMSVIDKTEYQEGKEIESAQPQSFVKVKATQTTSNPFSRFLVHYVIGSDFLIESYFEGIVKHYQLPSSEIRELVV